MLVRQRQGKTEEEAKRFRYGYGRLILSDKKEVAVTIPATKTMLREERLVSFSDRQAGSCRWPRIDSLSLAVESHPSSTIAPTPPPPPLSIARARLWYKGFRAFTWFECKSSSIDVFWKGSLFYFYSPLHPSSSSFSFPVCLFIKLEFTGPLL